MKKILSFLSVCLALPVAAFTVAEIKASRGNTHTVPDVLLLLGYRLKDNKPEPILKMRVAAAAEYLMKNPGVRVIVCGGKLEKEQSLSEAQVMRDMLTDLGVQQDRIILEDKSKTTRENFRNALKIIENMGLEKPHTAMLSSDFHLLRASLLAKKCGLQVTTIAAPSPKEIKMLCYIREFFCFPELLKGE